MADSLAVYQLNRAAADRINGRQGSGRTPGASLWPNGC